MRGDERQTDYTIGRKAKSGFFIILMAFLAAGASATIASMNAAYAETVSDTIQLGPDGVGAYLTAVNPETDMIYVANMDNGLVFVVDGNTNEVVASIQMPYDPPSVIPLDIVVDVSNNKVYVADNWGGLIVIDGATNTISQTVSFDSSSVMSAAVNPDTNKIYVINPPNVSVLDVSTYELIRTISIPDSGNMADIAINPVTNMVYVGGAGSAYTYNTVAMIDGSTDQFVSKSAFCRVHQLAINTETNTLYAANPYDGDVCVIDGSTNTVIDTIPLATYQSAIDVNPNLNRVYVHVDYTNEITVIDGSTNSIIETIPVGSNPLGLAVNPDSDLLYVADHDQGTLFVLDPSSTSTSSTTSTLTVSSKDASGSPIYGYYTTVSQNGQTSTGFTTATFQVIAGQNFEVSAASYGSCNFDHWFLGSHFGQSTSKDNPLILSIPASIQIYAEYNCGTANDGSGGQDDGSTETGGSSSVTVNSKDSSGNDLNGYYTILYDSNGNVAQTGFTPATFDLTSGQQYTIEVQDYGSYYFNYWQDDSSTDRDRTFTAADSAQIFDAVYSTSPQSSGSDNGSENSGDSGGDTGTGNTGSTTISVTTTDSAGNQIYGYYTTLSENGNIIQSAFSPAEFTVNSGQTYQVAVADYGQYVFDHWSDGSTDRSHNAEAGDSLVAVYRP